MKGLIFAASIISSTSISIGGISMPDQWGNPWLEIKVLSEKQAIVSLFDCDGKPKAVGEVPVHSVGSENNFSGFRPYLTATLADLTAISIQAAWEKQCMADSKMARACEPNPRRDDCAVVERPTGRALMVPQDAWKTYQALHPEQH